MQKIGFLGMGVMGLPMAKNVVQKCGLPVLGYDVVQQQMDAFREAGGKNESAIQWDMINDMTREGKIYADGELFYENGKFKEEILKKS